MDILKDKSYKTYNSLSRYSSFPYYYNTLDNKYVYGITNQLGTNIEYVLHHVSKTDTLDYLALKYYGRPDFYWVIADFNRIQDTFIPLYKIKKDIKIPSLSAIYYEG